DDVGAAGQDIGADRVEHHRDGGEDHDEQDGPAVPTQQAEQAPGTAGEVGRFVGGSADPVAGAAAAARPAAGLGGLLLLGLELFTHQATSATAWDSTIS